MGTRLRSVAPSVPKPLAPVGSKVFLDLLVRQLRHQGIHRLVMCTGYRANQIKNEFGNGRNWDVTIEYSKEPHPLGTAGAVKLARRYLRDASEFIVMNGDSFLEINFRQLMCFHREHGGLVSMAVLQVNNSARYGTVKLEQDGRVTGFAEKTGSDVLGVVNAGVYIFSRAVLDYIPEGPASLERDVFPRLLDRGVYGLKQYGMFIDIGTPEDYYQAQDLSNRLCEAALPRQ